MLSDGERDGGHGDVPIRDAACLILVDRAGQDARMLMGRRRATQVFLPNKWVFPGGRVDDDDRQLAEACKASGSSLTSGQHAFALAAVRETFEETGILISTPGSAFADPPEGWQAFARFGSTPDTSGLLPVARAITPPGRPRRFDTWFFLAGWQSERRAATCPDGELLDLGWFTVGEALALDLPIITRLIVDDVAMLLGPTVEGAHASGAHRIPFYYQDGGTYRRELIDI